MGDDFLEPVEAATADAAGVPSVAQVLPALQHLTVQLAAVTGAQTDRMTRDHGWRLLSVGRLIERLAGMASALVTLLDALDPRGARRRPPSCCSNCSTAASRFAPAISDTRTCWRWPTCSSSTTPTPGLRRHAAAAAHRDRQAARQRRLARPVARALAGAKCRLTLAELAAGDDAAVKRRLAQLALQMRGSAVHLSDAIGRRYFAHATVATGCNGSEPMTDSDPAAAWLEVEHLTTYRYAAAVDVAHHLGYLRPIDDDRQRVTLFEMDVEPAPTHRRSDTDVLGNQRTCFTVTLPHRELQVRAMSQVRVQRGVPFDAAASQPWEQVRDRLRYVAAAPYEPAGEFVFASPYVPDLPALHEWALPSFTAGRPVALAAIDLMSRIHAGFAYRSASTTVDTPLADVFAARAGCARISRT